MWLKHIESTSIQKEERRGKRYLEFLEVGFRVINQGESSRLSTTELSTETECLDSFFGSFVESRKASTDFIFGKICFRGMEDINNLEENISLNNVVGWYELFAVEESVCDEFAGA